MSSKLSIIVFSTNPGNNNHKNIFLTFLTRNSIQTHQSKSNEKYLSFDYEIKTNPTMIDLYFMNSWDNQYGICWYAHGYVIFVDIENPEWFAKWNEIVLYIKESCSEERTCYVIGLYSNACDITQTYSPDKIISLLNYSNWIFKFTECCLSNEDNIQMIVDSTLVSINEEKKTENENQCNTWCEENYFDRKEGSNSKSNCVIVWRTK